MDENNNFEYTNYSQGNYQNYNQNQYYNQPNDSQPNDSQPEKKKKKGMPTALKVILIVLAVIVGIGGIGFGVAKATGLYDFYKNALAAISDYKEGNGSGEYKSEKKFSFSLPFGKDGEEADEGAREPEAQDEAKAPEEENKTPLTTDGKEVVQVSDHDVSGIAEMCMPSIVAIASTKEYEAYSWFSWGESQTYEASSSGSGIIIGEDDDEYMIATNNHVVEDAKAMIVTFIDGTTANAVLKGRDASKDVAVIAVKKADLENGTADNIKIAAIGDSESLKVGQGVVAIGNALGYGQSVTVGYISALDRNLTIEETNYEHLIQTDAAINPGNSGGALINMKGEIIGINSAKMSSSKIEGVGYAIPIGTVEDILNNFSNQEARTMVDESEQGYLGIQGQTIDANTAQQYGMPEGVYIYKIIDGVPAKDSDLEEKDVITNLDGNSISDMTDLRELLAYYKGGETVQVTVQRLEDGEYVEHTIEVKLAYKRDTLEAPVENE